MRPEVHTYCGDQSNIAFHGCAAIGPERRLVQRAIGEGSMSHRIPVSTLLALLIAAGGSVPTSVRAGGSVVAWGCCSPFGKCDVPAPNGGFVRVSAGGSQDLALRPDGSLVAWCVSSSGSCAIPEPNTGFVAMAGGEWHSLGLKADSSIVAWGGNNYHQCNVPLPNAGFVAVAAGDEHSLGLRSDGSVAAWGNNRDHQCDVPQPNAGFVAIAAGSIHSLGVKADGSVVAWGFSGGVLPAPNSGFVAVAGGFSFSLGLKADGTVVGWGRNDSGQCDVPEPNADFVEISATDRNSVGLKADGRVVVWGYDGWPSWNPPESPATFVAVSAGGNRVLGLCTQDLPSGACCSIVSVCRIAVEANCLSLSTWVGEGTLCSPKPCSGAVMGACCHWGQCTIETATDCAAHGSWYFGDGMVCRICGTTPCPTTGAQEAPSEDTPVTRSLPTPSPGPVRIEYVQPAAGEAALRIYSVAGSLVRSLHASVVNPGNQVFLWDGCDEEGSALPSGIYLTQITAGRLVLNGKAVLGK